MAPLPLSFSGILLTWTTLLLGTSPPSTASMKSSSVVLLAGLMLLAIFSLPTNAKGGLIYRPDHEHAGTCKLSGERRLKAGAIWYPRDACEKYSCEITNTEVITHRTTCAVVDVDPPCALHTDMSKTYPGCCPKRRCPKNYRKYD